MARINIAIAALLSLGPIASAQTTPGQATTKPAAEQKDDLTNLDLGDLAKMTVTSASKKAESLFGVAAAISVVTAEDIKRSGATNIPEALRLVPGVQVAQVNATQYAVTIRGINSLYSAKLLVLIDGRSIYNNFWGGVYWEDQAISMDEIDRIEVIKGPGGTLWGANAVNGIINIITKKAKDTKGAYVSVGAASHGTLENGTIRYGGSLGHGDYRVTAYGIRDEQSFSAKTGNPNSDQRNGDKVSFRYDGGSDETGKVLLEGDLHRFDYRQAGSLPTSTFPFSSSFMSTDSDLGGSILAKVEKSYSNGSSNSFQASYDHTYKYVSPQILVRDGTIDIQVQHGFQQIGNNSIIAGAGYRTVADDYTNPTTVLNPGSATTRVYSFFGQDQIKLSETTKLTAGAKVEHNDFTAWEIEPSARLSVQPDDKQTWWCSVSRAVATPNRATANLDLPYQYVPVPIGGGNYLPGYVTLFGNPNLKSTDMIAVESGYRKEISSKLTGDISVFQNSYTHLGGTAAGATIPGDPVIIPVYESDLGSATVRGLELSAKFQATSKLRFDFGYSYEYSDLDAGSFVVPKHEIRELGTYTVSDKLYLDQAIYWAGAGGDGNASYHRMDVQLRYKATKNCDFSIGGRNLGNGQYSQIGQGALASGQLVRPAIYSQLTVKF